MLRWRPLEPFGIEIDHDFAIPLDADQTAEFVRLFGEAGLVAASSQMLSAGQQRALLAHLGPILDRIGESGVITTEHAHAAVRAPLTFHSDAAYTPEPFEAIALHAIDVVDGASSTRFVHAERAYASLPSALRATLDEATVEMVCPGHAALGVRACDGPDMAIQARRELPAVIVNPRTGRRLLGIGEMHTARIVGLDRDKSRELLEQVFAHLYAADAVLEHVWRRGDLVLWDNVALQHARGSLETVGRRVLQRTVVGVERESVPERLAAAAAAAR